MWRLASSAQTMLDAVTTRQVPKTVKIHLQLGRHRANDSLRRRALRPGRLRRATFITPAPRERRAASRGCGGRLDFSPCLPGSGLNHPALDLRRDGPAKEFHLHYEPQLLAAAEHGAVQSGKRPCDDLNRVARLQAVFGGHWRPGRNQAVHPLQVDVQPLWSSTGNTWATRFVSSAVTRARSSPCKKM